MAAPWSAERAMMRIRKSVVDERDLMLVVVVVVVVVERLQSLSCTRPGDSRGGSVDTCKSVD